MAHRVNKSRKLATQRRKKTARGVSAKKAKRAAAGNGVLYLYGVTRAAGAPPEAAGVDGKAAVEGLACSGLTAWVSRVDAREYGAELERNIENLDWLAEASVRHQRVVAGLSQQRTVLPARFGTVFLSEKSLAADVAKRKKEMEAALRRLADADEWGVKVFRVEQPVQAAMSAATGRDYLSQKAAMLKPSGPSQLADEVRELATALSKVAADAVPAGKVSSGQRGLEWQASFLVRRADRGKWDDILARFARRWGYQRRIECTGPWPPYSFVSPHAR
jgi:hypothetical protein